MFDSPAGVKNPTLHRASLLAPVSSPPLEDGAVLVGSNSILAAGPYREVRAQCPPGTVVKDHGDSALIPALVNAHAHLELSFLRGAVPLPTESFSAWLKELLPRRSSSTIEERSAGFRKGLDETVAMGCALIADITNGEFLGTRPNACFPHRQAFLEVLGFNRSGIWDSVAPELRRLLEADSNGPAPPSLAAHAVYSTSATLIRESWEWRRERNRPFSIHVAEHPEEMEFLAEGTGFFREFLEQIGRWVPGWKPPGVSPVAYLNSLGVLDSWTILAHAVHMTEEDWETVSRKHCAVCFCPRSNRNLNVGAPNIARALASGATAALGTDSLAGNLDLSIFSEGAFVLERYPGIRPEEVLSMMTLGGAKALHRADAFGSIETGKLAAILSVPVKKTGTTSELVEFIIDQGRQGAFRWASRPPAD